MATSDNVNILFRLLGDSKGLDKATTQGKKSLGGLGDTFKKVAGVAGLAFGANEVIKGVQASITAANDYAESLNAVNVAAGESADEIIALGEAGVDKLGLSKLAVNELGVSFSGFVDQMSAGGMDVDGVYEDLITRAVDFGSVMNISGEDAAKKFSSALAGSSEVLMQYGIDISAAAVEQYAWSNGITEAGKKLTNQQKVVARYGLLMQKTSGYAGDFANTSDGLAGQQKKLQAAMENAAIALGDELLPVMTELTTVLADMAPHLAKVAAGVRPVIATFKSFTQVGNVVSDTGNNVNDVLAGMVDGFKTVTGISLVQWGAKQVGAVTGISDALDNTTQKIPEWYHLFSGTLSQGFEDAADAADTLNQAVALSLDPDELAAFKAKSDQLVWALGNIQQAYNDAATAAQQPLSVSGSLAVDDRNPADFEDQKRNYERVNGPVPD